MSRRISCLIALLIVISGCELRKAPPAESPGAAPPPAAVTVPPPPPPPPRAPVAAPPPAPQPAPAPAPKPDLGQSRGEQAKRSPPTASEALPAFPWPPPRTTARYTLPRDLATAHGRLSTLGAVADHMEAALQAQGYTQLSYYGVPDGFALVTQVEQIHSDGRPVSPPDRWLAELQPVSLANFSLGTYLKALLRARRGYYRIIVFVASPHPFREDLQQRVSREEAQDWFHGGLSKLPATVRGVAYGESYSLTALVYEFEQDGAGREARMRDPSPVTGEMHLKQAMILAALER